jgi:D-sedoheptulose 7-phosphate isomerase
MISRTYDNDVINCITNYTKKLSELTVKTDIKAVAQAVDALFHCYKQGGCIFVFGNGGSAATANHFAADFEKNSVKGRGVNPRIISLSSDCSKILAYGNDIDFAEVFSSQLTSLAKEEDIAIAISASGNSSNIVHAIESAQKLGLTTIGLSGFTGGKLKEMCDISIHFSVDSYEVVEDLHSMICHMTVLCFEKKLNRGAS